MTPADFEQARFNMIEQQIRPWNVLDPHILHLLSVLRREDFVPAVHRALAFVDMEIPLRGSLHEAQRTGQCMLAPKVEARMLQDLQIQKHESVLEIGTGSGYMAGLLGHLAQQVLSLEIDPGLLATARDNLRRAGIHNVELRQADGAAQGAGDGMFDVIVLSGSVAQLPQNLLDQLKPGGRIATIVGQEPVMRFTRATRAADGSLGT
ncbi:MAG: protein-L-isoaspartate O-methyltransferase, partial [Burkholderiaceae bacterium]|nr:protein-L-isoaspartate O-methyltransferase [Burkholderiaceae bacterium]